MRLAVLSDIHGNLHALDAVLADASGRSIDMVLNLGDLVSGGLDPAGTIERLMAQPQVTLAGNHERQLLETPRAHMSPSDKFAFDRLSTSHRDWLAALPATAEPVAGVFAFHGTPTSDTTYLLETVESGRTRPATLAEIEDRLGGEPGWTLGLCGHTHLARVVTTSGGTLILNPGSVGWPAYVEDSGPAPHIVESGSPHARYAIADNSTGAWSAELIAVTYDWNAAARLARDNNRPDVSHQLLTGRALNHIHSTLPPTLEKVRTP